MKIKSSLNLLLFVALTLTVTLCWIVKARDVSRPNYDFLPETQMAYSVAYDSFSPNPNFPDGLTLRSPPAGTIARGHLPLHYQPTYEDALRAGQELQNPFTENDTSRRERGRVVFANYCQLCHGATGEGNGPITQAGFPPPASLLADRAVQMKDGQMFHVITYGQLNMPAFNPQLSRADRWSVILYVRMLQGPSAPSSVPSRSQAVARLFRENCAACHGEDGTGNNLRKVWPLLPDFTNLAWQMSQTEMALMNQIRYGSHPLMPAFRYKLPEDQILGLAVYVRSLAAHPVSPQAPSTNITAANVFGTNCFVCHDTTGRGNPLIRPAMPELPDFTAVAWQKTRTEAELAQSILLGKGKFMRPMSDKLGTVDIKQMVALVRGFQGGKQVIPPEGPAAPVPSSPVPSAPVVVATPSTELPVLGAGIVGSISLPAGQGSFLAAFALSRRGSSMTTSSTPRPSSKDEAPVSIPSEESAARVRNGSSIFRQYCFVCHGPDGKGTKMRPVLPPIPDFTNAAWHRERSDAQLRVSILEGKGTMMPANRGRVTEEQAGDLVAFIRTFGPVKPVTSKTQAVDSDFAKSFRQLEEELNQLTKELQKINAQK